MKKKGFTLVEVIITIAILATLAAIIFPSASYLIGLYKNEQCLKNQEANNSLYPSFLENEGLIDKPANFKDYLLMTKTMTCPENGVYSWDNLNKKANCSIHSDDESYRSYYEKIYKQMVIDYNKSPDKKEFLEKYDQHAGGDTLLKYLGKLLGEEGLTEWPKASGDAKEILENMSLPTNDDLSKFKEVPLYLKDGIVIYYTAKSVGFKQGEWKGTVIYCPINDTYYQSTKIVSHTGKTDNNTVLYPGGTDGSTQAEYIAWLESPNSGWQKIEK